MEEISTLLSTGSVLTLKMVIQRTHSLQQRCVGGRSLKADMFVCLLSISEELPDGFSQQLQEENLKSRPKFQPPPQQKPAAQSPKESNNACKETPKVCVCVCHYTSCDRAFECVCGVCQVTEKDEAASMKDWILRYAEQSSSEDEEEEGGEQTRNPELEEKFDPVS